jgi:hypothetical protein
VGTARGIGGTERVGWASLPDRVEISMPATHHAGRQTNVWVEGGPVLDPVLSFPGWPKAPRSPPF